MPATTGVIPNLMNGVSQQAPALRLPSQAELSRNFYPNVVDGNSKRPRTDHLAPLANLPADAFTHFILRDQDEKYVVAILTNGTIRVWDFEGDEKEVNDESDGYLDGITSAKDDIRALTVADHTFVTNKKKVVAAGSTTEPTRPYEAIFHVLAGNYGRDYTVYINNTLEALVRTPNGGTATDAPYVDTARIAEALRELLDDGSIVWIAGSFSDGRPGQNGASSQSGGGGFNVSPWSLARYNATVYLANATTDFTIRTEDGYSGRAMKEVKKEVAKFSDLPVYCHDGFVVRVKGSENNVTDDYWVKFDKENDENGAGVWKECVAPGTVLGLAANTMPHILVRESDGTFTFKAATWEDRKCGDGDTVPDPSFVGQTVEDLLFHRNRLGLMSKENVILSEHGKFYNFFRTTLTALLDTDPIDTAASHVKISLLRHAVPYQKELILFSDETQFVFAGNELLTPKTASADPVTELDSHPRIRPLVVGSNVYFVAEKGDWASVFEYFLDKALETADFDEVTGHVPAYIPAGVRFMAASSTLNLVAVTTEGDPDSIFLYSFYWNGQEKLQSAWVVWDFPEASEIVNIVFDRNQLRALVRRGSMVFLESINCDRKATDDDATWSARLDRHVILEDGVYDSNTGLTTFTLPYNATELLRCVTAPGGAVPAGVELDPTSTAMDEVVLDGDWSSQPIHFGIVYESRYRFSPFFHREENQQAVVAGRTQIYHLTVAYTRTAYFRVEVTCDGRAMRSYPFVAAIAGNPATPLGNMNMLDGKLTVPIMSRNDRVVIDLVNDSWHPCAFTGARWTGVHSSSKEL
jgi:hypothetical protein